MTLNDNLETDLILRISNLQKELQRQSVDACILSTSVNIFYLSGIVYNGYVYVPAEGDIIHFVKRPQMLSLNNIIYIRKPEQIREELEKRGKNLPDNVSLEVDSLPYTDCQRLISSLNIANVANASTLLRKIRSVKTAFELTQVRLCAQKHVEVYNQIPSVFRKGMTDVELQIEIERLMRQNGSLGIFRSYGENMDIYMGSLLVGKNAEVASPFDFALGGGGINPILPLGASGERIEEGQTIMVDMAGNYSPWMTDMTRVFSLGKTTELAYKAHQVSIEIHEYAMSVIKPGVSCAEIYNKAMEIVEQNDLQPYFMGTDLQAKFIGHGVGLEINEPPVFTPRSKEILEPNVVFALEPKFVIPDIGAVGVENTYVVTADGVDKVTILDENIIEL